MAQQAKAWPAIAGSRPSVKLRFSPLYQMYQSGTKVLTASVKERADGQKMPHHNSNVIYLLDLPQSVTDDEQSWWSCLETLTRQTWKSAEMKVNMHLDNEQMLLLTKLVYILQTAAFSLKHSSYRSSFDSLANIAALVVTVACMWAQRYHLNSVVEWKKSLLDHEAPSLQSSHHTDMVQSRELLI